MRRSVHYEAAFEAYLRARGWPYVVVDEAKKAVFANVSIKSFDFLVYSSTQPNLLVDVKGRKFPDGVHGAGAKAARAWENWVTRDDIESLLEWEKIFGRDFKAMLVFAYWLQGPPQRSPFEDVHFFRERHYHFAAIAAAEYAGSARTRSQRWQTLSMPSGVFVRTARDFSVFL